MKHPVRWIIFAAAMTLHVFTVLALAAGIDANALKLDVHEVRFQLHEARLQGLAAAEPVTIREGMVPLSSAPFPTPAEQVWITNAIRREIRNAMR